MTLEGTYQTDSVVLTHGHSENELGRLAKSESSEGMERKEFG